MYQPLAFPHVLTALFGPLVTMSLACGQQIRVQTGSDSSGGKSDHSINQQSPIVLDDAKYIAGENLNDSIRLLLYSKADIYIVGLEKLLSQEGGGATRASVLDTIEFRPPGTITSFVRCSSGRTELWVPFDKEGVMPPYCTPWTVQERGKLVKLDPGTFYECNTGNEIFIDD